jgi:hypothetical protein
VSRRQSAHSNARAFPLGNSNCNCYRYGDSNANSNANSNGIAVPRVSHHNRRNNR